jgi:hypothetical protein
MPNGLPEKHGKSGQHISRAQELIQMYVRIVGNTTENISGNGGRVKDYFRTNPK